MRKILINSLLFAGSLLFVSVALEGGLRLLNYPAPRYVTPDLYVDVSGMHLPNAKGYWRGRLGSIMDFDNLVVTNSQFLHDTDHSFVKPENTYRILFLGDSFVEAAQVPLEDTFFKIAEKQLNEKPLPALKGKKVESVAIGRSGSGSIVELDDLAKEGLRYNPDLVVVFVLAENDFSDDLFYRYNKNKNTVKKILFADTKTYDEFDLYKRALIFKDSYVNRWIAFLLTERVRQPRVTRESVGLLKRDLGVYAATDSVLFKEQLASWESAIRLTSSNYVKMKAICRQKNIEFKVVLIDSQLLYNTRKRKSLYKMMPELSNEHLDFEKTFTRLKQVFNHAGIDYLDLNPSFEENYKKNGPPTHFEHDGHWTKEGHKLAARVFIEHLK